MMMGFFLFDLQSLQKPHAAALFYVRALSGERVETLCHVSADLLHIFHDMQFLKLLENAYAGGAGQRVAAVGRAVIARHKSLCHRILRGKCPQRNAAAEYDTDSS